MEHCYMGGTDGLDVDTMVYNTHTYTYTYTTLDVDDLDVDVDVDGDVDVDVKYMYMDADTHGCDGIRVRDQTARQQYTQNMWVKQR